MFREVAPDWADHRISSGLSTGEGLIHAVRDQVEKLERKKKGEGYEQVIVDEGVADKRLLDLETEFASVLKVLSREGNTLSAVIRNAWDRGNLSILYKGSFPDAYRLKPDDLLMVMTDLSYKKLILGRCVLVNQENLLLNQRVAKIIIRSRTDSIHPSFLIEAINDLYFRGQIISAAMGTTVFHTSPSKIKNSLLCLPPLEEQKHIVRTLETKLRVSYSAVIKLREQITFLQEHRSALISAAVTGKIDVREAHAHL